MNDDVQPPDTPSDELEAVSAVLDGIATPEQLAMVEASAELTVQLEEFRAARDQLRAVRAPAAQRDSAIAAALAAFDDLHTGDDTPATGAATPAHPATPPANVVSLDSRRRWYRRVAGAAAALVLVAGVAAAVGSSGGSDDDSGDATAATSSQKTAADDAAGGADASTLADQAPTAIESATEMAAGTLPPADATEAPSATDSPSAQDDTGSAQTTTAPTIGEIPGPAETRTVIDDPQALATFAADAPSLDREAADDCIPSGDDDLGSVTYQDTPAVVGRRSDDGLVTVYAEDDCSVLTTLDT